MKYIQCPWCNLEIPADGFTYHVVTAHATVHGGTVSCFCGHSFRSTAKLEAHLARLGVLEHLSRSTLYLHNNPGILLRLCGAQ